MLRHADCLCILLTRVQQRTHVLILRHSIERHKPSNTARLADLLLTNVVLMDHGRPGLVLDVAPLLQPGAALLFPEGAPWPSTLAPPTQLVVVDGSWPQARKMVQKLTPLHRLPRFSLVGGPPAGKRLRTPPHPDGMSTLEALAVALGVLEGPTVRDHLLDAHARFVEQVLQSKGLGSQRVT